MQHNFMPGDKVIYNNKKKGIVTGRGANPGRYFVMVAFDGNIIAIVNDDINKLKKI